MERPNFDNFKLFVFLREVKQELLRVSWPTKEETIRLTGIVILSSIAVGLFLGGVDFFLTKAIGLALQK